jgi:multidrug efflux pump
MRKALGVAVFSGMLGVTFFGIFLTPVFYYVIQWFAEGRATASTAAPSPGVDGTPPGPSAGIE